MLKKVIVIFIASAAALLANSSHEKEAIQGLKVHISLDKQKYFADEPVKLKIHVKNTTDENISFEVYDSEKSTDPTYTTFQPLIFDMKGREAESSVNYRLENRDVKQVLKGLYKRTVHLGPGESIVHAVNLREIYSLNKNITYRVKNYFFPDFSGNTVLYSDNELKFRIVEERSDIKQKSRDLPREISPSEVVLLVLNAEKGRDWDRLIKYIDPKKLISAYPDYVKRYNQADTVEKSRLEEEFLAFLSNDRDDYILDFRIKKEELEEDGRIAYVDVIIERFRPGKSLKYKYKYTLERHKNLWLVINLDASVIKGSAR